MYKLKTTVRMENSGGGTSNYEDLENKPQINGNELVGNKTSADLGLQPAGQYLTEETDPTVPSYVKNISENDIASWNNKSEFSGDYDDLTNKPDLSQFITNTVNNLTNYYLKSETYTKTEVNNLIGAIQQFHYEIVQELPQTGANNILYLVPKSESQTQNVYDEYVYANNTWEKIGDTEIDLSGYVTTTQLNTALANYTTTNDLTTLLAGKQNVFQYSTMPTAGADNLGKIVQYTGATDSTYTQGHFYIVVSDGESTPTYSWQEISLGGNSSNGVYYKTLRDYSSALRINTNYTSGDFYDDVKNAIQEAYDSGSKCLIMNVHYNTISIDTSHKKALFINADNLQNISQVATITQFYMINQWFNDGPSYPNYYDTYLEISGLSVSNGIININSVYFRSSYHSSQPQSFQDAKIELTRPYRSGAVTTVKYALATTNTTAYTPTSDYNPSTKKYTDDTALSTVVADKLTGTSAPTTSTVGYVGQQYTDTTNNNQYVCTAVDTVTPEYTWVQVNGGGSGEEQLFINHTSYGITLSAENLAILQQVYDKYVNNEPINLLIKNVNNYSPDNMAFYIYSKISGTTFYCYGMSNYTINNGVLWLTNTTINATITNGALSSGQIRTDVKSGTIPYVSGSTGVLNTNNTAQYTPTGDYNPATKKYVDDQVGAINTVLATLTTPTSNGGN